MSYHLTEFKMKCHEVTKDSVRSVLYTVIRLVFCIKILGKVMPIHLRQVTQEDIVYPKIYNG